MLSPRALALVAALALAWGSPAAAYVSITRSQAPPQAVERPAVEALDEGGGTARPEPRIPLTADEPLSLAANRVFVTIRDQVAVVRVEQVFQSNVGRILQARYTFPLGQRAHVSGYAIWEKGDKLVGELMEVSRAEALYRAVTSQELTPRHTESGVAQEVRRVAMARDPGILRQLAPGDFETHIYPILPYALKQLELLYAEAVPGDDGWCRWSFPLGPTAAFANPVGELRFEVVLADTAGLGEVQCAWPGATIEHDGESVRVTVVQRAARPPGPFELRWRPRLELLTAATLAHRTGPDEPGYALVRVPLPAVAAQERDLDVVLAVDGSGSFAHAPDKERRQRLALRALVAGLRSTDRLGWLRFGEAVAGERPLRAADPAVVAECEQRLPLPGPGGRTRLATALEGAGRLLGEPTPGRVQVVVLATDGVTLERPEEVLAAAPRGARLVVIATGHDDDMTLLSGLADRHGGTVWVPGEGERSVRWAARSPDLLRRAYGEALAATEGSGLSRVTGLQALVARLRRPVVSGARLVDPSGALQEAYPVVPARSWPTGGTAAFLLRYTRGGLLPVTFAAVVDGRPVEQALELSLPQRREERHRFVAAFWARARVEALLREHPRGRGDPHRPEIVELSLAHRFMTPYTAFLSLPDAERRRMLLGEAPPDDGADLYSFEFAGGAPEAEVWLLFAVGLATVLVVVRRRAGPGSIGGVEGATA